MLFLLVEFYRIVEFRHNTVYSGPDETGFPGIIENLLMFSFFPTYDRCKDLQFCPFFPTHNRIDNLIGSLLPDFPSALRTVRSTDTCIEQTVIIVNFSYRTNRGPRIVMSRFLFDRNGR